MAFRVALVMMICACVCLAPTTKANAGQADEILLGFVFGTSFGLVLSGALMVFYTNPDSDRNIETVMLTGGLIGATGGIIFGTFLPDDAVERDPVVGSATPPSRKVRWTPPSVSVTALRDKTSIRPGLFANVIQLSF